MDTVPYIQAVDASVGHGARMHKIISKSLAGALLRARHDSPLKKAREGLGERFWSVADMAIREQSRAAYLDLGVSMRREILSGADGLELATALVCDVLVNVVADIVYSWQAVQ